MTSPYIGAFILSFMAAGIGLARQDGARPAEVDGVPAGRIVEGLSLPSAVLGREVQYAVYLPPDYAASTRRYPVVYLLHGFTDDESAWVQFGEVNRAADKGIEAGDIPPLIIVMPDAGVTWYINDHQGKVRYEDMFVQELIPHVDKTYRTRPKREFRGVAGLSMGGWGALVYALRHPDLFAACAAFSAAVWTDEDFAAWDDKSYGEMLGPVFGPHPAGAARLTAHYQSYNPLDLARTMDIETLKKVRYYLDCGDDDFLFKGNSALHVVLAGRKIPHEFRVRDGGHTWAYWRTGIGDGLAFIGRSFHR